MTRTRERNASGKLYMTVVKLLKKNKKINGEMHEINLRAIFFGFVLSNIAPPPPTPPARRGPNRGNST